MVKKKNTTKQTKKKKNKLPIILKTVSITILSLFLIILALPEPNYTKGFETIDEVIEDCSKKDEFAEPESYNDTRRPSWKTYQEKIKVSFIQRKINNFLTFVGIKKRPPWSPSFFVNLLEKQINEKTKKGYKSEYVIRLTPNEDARFIILGDLCGAYHSLARDLQQMINLNLLDKNLKLINKNDFLVFMGDAPSKSPFCMEILTLIMKLEANNPNQVFYIAGNHERNKSWYYYGLGEELEFKINKKNKENIATKIDKYFYTLPLAIYLSIPPHNTNEFVRISHFALEKPSSEKYREFVDLLNPSHYAIKLLENKASPKQKIVYLSDKSKLYPSKKTNLKGIIKSIYKMKNYQKTTGLKKLISEKAAVSWTLLSCPTLIIAKHFSFYNDSFSLLNLSSQFNKWTITQNSRDRRTKKAFKFKTYNFRSGKEVFG